MFSPIYQRKIVQNTHTVAFYNLENLFDTYNDAFILDDDYTATGFREWTPKRYHKKLNRLAKAISKIGFKNTYKAPVLIGVAEVENNKVMQDLIAKEPLAHIPYNTIHFDSPDERGIDTGLIYDTRYFTVEETDTITIMVNNLNGERDTTRDVLYVKGLLNGEWVHIFVNHWPSRRDGEQDTEYKRIEAAATIGRYMDAIEQEEADPNYIIMGDFNDSPANKSMALLMERGSLYNPMKSLLSPRRGSANYRRKWSLFDQILVSHNFFNYEKGTHSFTKADIFDEQFLQEYKGKYKGSPYRTFVGKKYRGGYSDHFPVYIQLKMN